MTIHPEVKKTAQMILSKKHNVAYENLEYIGFVDEIETVDKVIVYFNVMDPIHPKFKSTICHVF